MRRMEQYFPVGWTKRSQVSRENTKWTNETNDGGLFTSFTCFGAVPRPLELKQAVLGEDDDITLFSVASLHKRRNWNRVRELFTRAVMPTRRIPFGNGSGRAAILPSKQVLAFLWSMANQEPARAVGRHFRQEAITPCCSISGLGESGPSRNGRMEQNFPVIPIFRNFRPTSRGTPKISEWNSGKCLFHSLPYPEFPEFLVEWKAPQDSTVVILKPRILYDLCRLPSNQKLIKETVNSSSYVEQLKTAPFKETQIKLLLLLSLLLILLLLLFSDYLVDRYDSHANDIWLFQNKYLDP